MKKNYYRVLTIAGSDSGGGAGIQADLKTFSALGTYGMSVITALTAQNTQEVRGIQAISPEFVAQQMGAVLEDIGVDAVKIGMLHSAEIIEVVAENLEKYRVPNIVLDPVMVAQNGDKLLKKSAIEALKHVLIPLATILTPNLPEAEVLLDRKLANYQEMSDAAQDIVFQYKPESVLLKGGHLRGAYSTDILYLRNTRKFAKFKKENIATKNTHGTGCTLSSAIAAGLAKGMDLENAVQNAKDYLTKAIQAGAEYELGEGHGPVKHFWEFW